MAIDYNELIKKMNYLPPTEQESIMNIIDDKLEEFEDQKLYAELDKIKEEMARGEYYTEDQIKWKD